MPWESRELLHNKHTSWVPIGKLQQYWGGIVRVTTCSPYKRTRIRSTWERLKGIKKHQIYTTSKERIRNSSRYCAFAAQMRATAHVIGRLLSYTVVTVLSGTSRTGRERERKSRRAIAHLHTNIILAQMGATMMLVSEAFYMSWSCRQETKQMYKI